MKRLIIVSTLVLLLTVEPTGIVVHGQTYDSETMIEDQYLQRASRIISSSGWNLNKRTYNIVFLNEPTGYGTIKLQRKSGNQWTTIGSVDVEFINTTSINGYVDADISLSGTYRMVYDLTVGSMNETIESSTQSK